MTSDQSVRFKLGRDRIRSQTKTTDTMPPSAVNSKRFEAKVKDVDENLHAQLTFHRHNSNVTSVETALESRCAICVAAQFLLLSALPCRSQHSTLLHAPKL